jgi:hypothetical protein
MVIFKGKNTTKRENFYAVKILIRRVSWFPHLGIRKIIKVIPNFTPAGKSLILS